MASARLLRTAALVVTAAVTLAGCGGDDGATEDPASASPEATATGLATDDATTSTTTAPAAGPVTVTDSLGNELTLAAPPEAIVSLSPTATESLFAIGAGDQVVAVDEYSYYPDDAPVTDLSGFTPNAEAVAAYAPDLVVIQNDANDLVAQLDALDIPVLVQGAAVGFADVYEQIETLGVVTGHADQAGALAETMRSDIDDIVAAAPGGTAGLRYFHEISTDYYTTSSAGFIGAVYGLFDLVNIADEAAEAAGTEFPQMSEEAIIEADPQVVYTTSGATPEDVARRPGWGGVTAVQNDAVVMLPPDIPSRWGPRVVEFVQVVADSLDAAVAAQ